MADALAEAMQGDLATEAELESEVQSVGGELRETELRREANIEAGKADLIEWLVGVIGFQTIVLLDAALPLARAVAHRPSDLHLFRAKVDHNERGAEAPLPSSS